MFTNKPDTEQSTEKEFPQHNSELSSENIQRLPVAGTPFWVIGSEEKKFHLTIGQYRLTKEPLELDDINRYLETHQWELVIQLFGVLMENYELNNLNIKNNQK